MASYKNGSITLENVYGKKTYETTIVECGSSTELQELTITENGTYTAEDGKAYNPVNVNVPPKEEETKSITITENGTTTVLPTSGKVLSKVDIVANVALEGNPMQEYVNNNGGDGVPSCKYLFYKYLGTSLDNVLNGLDTSSVTNISSMFYQCSNLTSIPLLDTSSATDMSYMFYECKKLTSIPQLDTSSCTNTERMFFNCSSLTSIHLTDTSKVTNMIYMFNDCFRLTSISALDVSKATNTYGLFSGCRNLTTIPALDTSYDNNMLVMFSGCSKLEKIDITKLSYNNTQFAENCYSLKKLIIRTMDTIPNLKSNAFNNCYHFYGTTNATYNPEGLKDGAIYVPDDKVEELKVATNWSTFADIIKPLSTYVEV